MTSISRRMLTCVVACILISTSCTGTAKDSPVAPIQALKTLYENDKKFHTTMDQAFANVKDPDLKENGWPHNCTTKNPWKGKQFDYLLKFFDNWYHLRPVRVGNKECNLPPITGHPQDEFDYIETFAWFYYKNPFGQQIVSTNPELSWSRDFVKARGKFMDSEKSAETIKKWTDNWSIHPSNGFRAYRQLSQT